MRPLENKSKRLRKSTKSLERQEILLESREIKARKFPNLTQLKPHAGKKESGANESSLNKILKRQQGNLS
jgi:hypothetical protein